MYLAAENYGCSQLNTSPLLVLESDRVNSPKPFLPTNAVSVLLAAFLFLTTAYIHLDAATFLDKNVFSS
jgi:hypothetical protein